MKNSEKAGESGTPKFCPYEHKFIGFLGPDKVTQCVKLSGHEGNHVVIEPRENKLLEVPR